MLATIGSIYGAATGSRNECFFEEMSDKNGALLIRTFNPDF
jgi:hypothetical protein